MTLAARIDPAWVFADLAVDDARELFERVARSMAESGFLQDARAATERLLERERIMSTAIAPGVAVPHARCPDAEGVGLALVRVAGGGLEFGARDGRPVRLVFILLGPPESTAEHVKVLGQVARLIRQPQALDRLLQAPGPEELLEALQAATDDAGGG